MGVKAPQPPPNESSGIPSKEMKQGIVRYGRNSEPKPTGELRGANGAPPATSQGASDKSTTYVSPMGRPGPPSPPKK